MKSTCEWMIPFHYADVAGIMFFGHAFTLAHQSLETYVNQRIGWHDWFQHPEWMIPIVHTEASYHAPLLAGQVCEIDLFSSHIGHTSFEITYECIQNAKKCCTLKTVHVFCDRKTKNKQPLPIWLVTHLTHSA